MLIKELKDYNIVLGSASPRRKELLAELELEFIIKSTDKEEDYSKDLGINEIAKFLAKQKADIIARNLEKDYLLITADTIVAQNGEVIHKPKNKQDAIEILRKLSGNSHKVITGVCITSSEKKIVFSSITDVFFTNLSDEEINFYIERYKPFDKAGAYGIQDWIGFIGIEKIIGSYNNVVGLPTTELYNHLVQFAG